MADRYFWTKMGEKWPVYCGEKDLLWGGNGKVDFVPGKIENDLLW